MTMIENQMTRSRAVVGDERKRSTWSSGQAEVSLEGMVGLDLECGKRFLLVSYGWMLEV